MFSNVYNLITETNMAYNPSPTESRGMSMGVGHGRGDPSSPPPKIAP